MGFSVCANIFFASEIVYKICYLAIWLDGFIAVVTFVVLIKNLVYDQLFYFLVQVDDSLKLGQNLSEPYLNNE